MPFQIVTQREYSRTLCHDSTSIVITVRSCCTYPNCVPMVCSSTTNFNCNVVPSYFILFVTLLVFLFLVEGSISKFFFSWERVLTFFGSYLLFLIAIFPSPLQLLSLRMTLRLVRRLLYVFFPLFNILNVEIMHCVYYRSMYCSNEFFFHRKFA